MLTLHVSESRFFRRVLRHVFWALPREAMPARQHAIRILA
jgi:hypothetical protein